MANFMLLMCAPVLVVVFLLLCEMPFQKLLCIIPFRYTEQHINYYKVVFTVIQNAACLLIQTLYLRQQGRNTGHGVNCRFVMEL